MQRFVDRYFQCNLLDFVRWDSTRYWRRRNSVCHFSDARNFSVGETISKRNRKKYFLSFSQIAWNANTRNVSDARCQRCSTGAELILGCPAYITNEPIRKKFSFARWDNFGCRGKFTKLEQWTGQSEHDKGLPTYSAWSSSQRLVGHVTRATVGLESGYVSGTHDKLLNPIMRIRFIFQKVPVSMRQLTQS